MPTESFRSVHLSGVILSISMVSKDKANESKFSICLGLKQNKRDLSKVWITCYNIGLRNEPWFKVKKKIFTESYWVNYNFYVLQYASYNSYDCYQNFIKRVNEAFEDEEDVG